MRGMVLGNSKCPGEDYDDSGNIVTRSGQVVPPGSASVFIRSLQRSGDGGRIIGRTAKH